MTDDATRKRWRVTLEIDAPSATCGYCNFTSRLTGTWSVEGGRLVWRADADPLLDRGPGLERCGEGSPVHQFQHIEVDGRPLTADQVATLRATAKEAPPWT